MRQARPPFRRIVIHFRLSGASALSGLAPFSALISKIYSVTP